MLKELFKKIRFSLKNIAFILLNSVQRYYKYYILISKKSYLVSLKAMLPSFNSCKKLGQTRCLKGLSLAY